MKKHILLFFVGILCNVGAIAENVETEITTQMNPFAYYLDAEPSKDYSAITIKYCLNADATSVTIVFLDGETEVKSVPINDANLLTKTAPYSQHSVVISTAGIPSNKDITWRIDVTGPERTKYGKYSQNGTSIHRYKFYRPSSVDIIQDPTSSDYGKVLVVESQHKASTTDGLHSSPMTKKNGNNDDQGAGIYVFNPDLTPRYNTSQTYVFNGTDDNRFKGTEFAPYRVRVSEDGRMFVSSLYPNGDILWEISKDFKSWSTVIGKGVSGTTWVGNKNTSAQVDTDYRLNTTNGDFIAAPNAGLDVRGKGADLKLLMLSCTEQAFGMGQPGFHTCEYNLGEAKTWNQVPSKDFKTNFSASAIDSNTGKPKSVFASNYTSNVQYDQEGGIWCISYRDQCSDALPGLVHKNANAEEDCRMSRSGTKNAALRFNKNFTQAIMASTDGWGTHYNYDPTHIENQSGQRGYFINERNINMTEIGIYLNDFAWDNADNIYVVGNSTQSGGTGYLAVYCLPHSADHVFSTPGNESIYLTETICWHPYPDGYEANNDDLWKTFQFDYNDWYRSHPSAKQHFTELQAHQPITNAIGFTFPSDKNNNDTYIHPDGLVSDFLTNNDSKWKWLGDYIAEVANPEIPEALGVAFMNAYNTYYGTSINVGTYVDNISGFLWVGSSSHKKDVRKMMTDVNSKWKWLGDYIQTISTNAGSPLNDEVNWRYSLTAFFQCGAAGTYNVDFSEAGKPENWQPYYVSPDGKKQISTEVEWRTEVHDFFNKINNYTTAGQPAQWKQKWWDATFKPTMNANDPLPTVKRVGYVLGGWYYGDNNGYSYNDKEETQYITRGGCLWARWLETQFDENYTTGTNANSASIEELGQRINRNKELIERTKGTSDYKMRISRKLQAGMYNTMALPFAIIGDDYLAQITNSAGQSLLPPATTSIQVFTGTSIIDNGVGEKVLVLEFHEMAEDETLTANDPFLVKPENNITEVMHTGWTPFINTEWEKTQKGYISFIPHLAPDVAPEEGNPTDHYILVADNRLARLTSAGTMLGLRGYFDGSAIPDDLSAAKVIVKITEKDGVVTYLDNIDSPQKGSNAIKILLNGNIYIIRDGITYTITGARVR